MVKNDKDRTKDKSEDINESQEKEMIPSPSEKSSKIIKTPKQRPKTAPPTQHHVVVSNLIESVKVLVYLFLKQMTHCFSMSGG